MLLLLMLLLLFWSSSLITDAVAAVVAGVVVVVPFVVVAAVIAFAIREKGITQCLGEIKAAATSYCTDCVVAVTASPSATSRFVTG